MKIKQLSTQMEENNERWKEKNNKDQLLMQT